MSSRAIKTVKSISRRRSYSDSTRRRLVGVAEKLFTEKGYAATSLDAIVAGADVTKGALYHHFEGKQALFEAVFTKIETNATKAIRKAQKRKKDPWEKAAAGLRTFLEVVQTPAYQRVIMQDGPGVLGHARFAEREERTTHETLAELVDAVLGDRRDLLDPEIVEALTHIFHGATAAAGSYVADSADPRAASGRVEAVIGFLLAGMRLQFESGRTIGVVGTSGEADPDGEMEPDSETDSDTETDSATDSETDPEDPEDPQDAKSTNSLEAS